MSRKLSDYEIDELVRGVTPAQRALLARLLEELREMRDQAAEREYAYEQEVTW